MTNKTANWVLVFFDLLALGSLYFLFHEHIAVISNLNNKADQIIFDTGLYYLILFTIFPLIRIVQLTVFISKAKNYQKEVNIIFITWFILCLVFANLFPYQVKSDLRIAGYHYCGNKDTHRISRGSSTIYLLSECQ